MIECKSWKKGFVKGRSWPFTSYVYNNLSGNTYIRKRIKSLRYTVGDCFFFIQTRHDNAEFYICIHRLILNS